MASHLKSFRDGAEFFRSTGIHRLVTTFPKRWVVTATHTGWNKCERCGADHKVWVTLDSIWKRVPRAWRSRRICTRCFRELV